MNFFITIYDLSAMEAIILNIFLIILNIFCSLSIRDLVRDKYNKTNSAEKALYLEHKLCKYFYFIITILCTAFSTLSLLPHLSFLGEFDFLCILAIDFLIYFMEAILLNLILYNINREIRKTTVSRSEIIKNLSKVLIIILIPIIIVLSTAVIKPFSFLVNIIFSGVLIIIFFS